MIQKSSKINYVSFIQYVSICALKHFLPAYKSARNKETIWAAGLVAIFDVHIPRRPLDHTFFEIISCFFAISGQVQTFIISPGQHGGWVCCTGNVKFLTNIFVKRASITGSNIYLNYCRIFIRFSHNRRWMERLSGPASRLLFAFMQAFKAYMEITSWSWVNLSLAAATVRHSLISLLFHFICNL